MSRTARHPTGADWSRSPTPAGRLHRRPRAATRTDRRQADWLRSPTPAGRIQRPPGGRRHLPPAPTARRPAGPRFRRAEPVSAPHAAQDSLQAVVARGQAELAGVVIVPVPPAVPRSRARPRAPSRPPVPRRGAARGAGGRRGTPGPQSRRWIPQNARRRRSTPRKSWTIVRGCRRGCRARTCPWGRRMLAPSVRSSLRTGTMTSTSASSMRQPILAARAASRLSRGWETPVDRFAAEGVEGGRRRLTTGRGPAIVAAWLTGR